MNAPAVILLTESGLPTARRIAAALPGATLHGPAGRVAAVDIAVDDLGTHLRELFAAGRPIVGLCATGILIRLLAPVLADKTAEPPVLAVAEDGSAVVPLLGGHRGANALAETLAAALGATAAITTAGDLRFGVALDAPPAGWTLANPEDVKAFTAALLAGETVALDGAAPWLADSDLTLDPAGRLTIRVTDRRAEGGPDCLVYHPRTLALGVGCERGTAPEELAALVRETLFAQGLAPGTLAGVFSIDVKMDEPAVIALAARLGVPARFFDAETLEAETPRLANPSDMVFREVGCHGVAEGAALAAAGPEAALIVPKQKSVRATCAVARAPAVLRAELLGRARGSLAIVGIGPGTADWRTPEADAAIAAASDLVGYGLYLDLLGTAADGKRRHDYALGEETERVRAALDLAAEGRDVALVSSGDAGIYAMAALVFEELAGADRPDWHRVAVRTVPGISALQAAAARIGAPLGHDFCAISLSDLLTPWEVIERRIRAAAEGDFVIAFYNPVSRRRTEQLVTARRILLSHRRADTPVVLARNLGRADEAIEVITLKDLAPARADMLTLVLVGSTETRRVPRGDGGVWVYTPRGYARKPDPVISA